MSMNGHDFWHNAGPCNAIPATPHRCSWMQCVPAIWAQKSRARKIYALRISHYQHACLLNAPLHFCQILCLYTNFFVQMSSRTCEHPQRSRQESILFALCTSHGTQNDEEAAIAVEIDTVLLIACLPDQSLRRTRCTSEAWRKVMIRPEMRSRQGRCHGKDVTHILIHTSAFQEIRRKPRSMLPVWEATRFGRRPAIGIWGHMRSNRLHSLP